AAYSGAVPRNRGSPHQPVCVSLLPAGPRALTQPGSPHTSDLDSREELVRAEDASQDGLIAAALGQEARPIRQLCRVGAAAQVMLVIVLNYRLLGFRTVHDQANRNVQTE